MTKPTTGCCTVFESIVPLAPRFATATVASAPIVHPLLARNLASASSVMNSSTMALDWAPACKPMEPPVML
ncbi:hypothetical protein D3C71_1896960 [compost metagenome]